jgi:iron-sulfur cluster repair protein YtfE (RIC family)
MPTGTPATEPHSDGREMLMLHRMFRREFGLAPALVRQVTPGDQDRERIVSGHLEIVAKTLNGHHGGEDAYVWPLLVQLCGDQVEPLVDLMESQHATVHALLDELETGRKAWDADASAEARDALAATLDELLPPLREHLAMEEARIVPLMEQHITKARWDEIIRNSTRNASPDLLTLGFGMMIYEADPDIVADTIANMPPEVRPVIRQIAEQAFAVHSQEVHGTAMPPRSTSL